MGLLDHLDWGNVRAHYDDRVAIHEELLRLHDAGQERPFAELLLGISDPNGNYSAAEHGLGPRIIASNGNAYARIDALGRELRGVTKPRDVPRIVRAAGLSYLAISVGSEASCLLNPTVCWVANTRTIWAHLVVKHDDSIATANEALRLYRDADASSEMAYQIWAAIHAELGVAMTRLAEGGSKKAKAAGVAPGTSKFLWADAIANGLYADHHG